jgi:hypothetical protein
MFPVVAGLLFGTVQFSMYMAARQQVQAASREGARKAARGGDQNGIEQTVRGYLEAAGLPGATIQVGPVDGSGHLLNDQGQQIGSGDPVRIVVRLPAQNAAPHLLDFLGFRRLHGDIIAQTVMLRE